MHIDVLSPMVVLVLHFRYSVKSYRKKAAVYWHYRKGEFCYLLTPQTRFKSS